jgi:hypothetical protein
MLFDVAIAIEFTLQIEPKAKLANVRVVPEILGIALEYDPVAHP